MTVIDSVEMIAQSIGSMISTILVGFAMRLAPLELSVLIDPDFVSREATLFARLVSIVDPLFLVNRLSVFIESSIGPAKSARSD
jgi:hypothetical protein